MDPFRLDVHRADGTRRCWRSDAGAYATLNDAFELRRRCRREDAIYGLGEKGGPRNRTRPRLHALEHRRARPDATAEFIAGATATRARPTSPSSTRTTSSIPFFYHHAQRTGAIGGVVHRQRLPRRVRLHGDESTRSASRAGSTRSTSSPARRMPDDPRGLHVAHRARCAAAAVGARLPPVPLVRLHAGRGRGARRAPPRARPPVRRAVARHRVHGRLPRLHLEHGARSRTRRGCSSGCASRASG